MATSPGELTPEGRRELLLETGFLAAGQYFLQLEFRDRSIMKGFTLIH